MDTYVANPVKAQASKILSVVSSANNLNEYVVFLEDGSSRLATVEMCARMTPKVGDYWVVQEDGYAYLNPKDVFERKYSKRPENGEDVNDVPIEVAFGLARISPSGKLIRVLIKQPGAEIALTIGQARSLAQELLSRTS